MLHLSQSPSAADVPAGAAGEQLSAAARDLRYQVVQLSHRAGTPHLGSALSVIDILVALYWRVARVDPLRPDNATRDRVILSKGHAATALYAALAARGFFPEAWLDTFAQAKSRLAEQPAPGCAPGVEFATGSLGHGLPVGTGLALGARILQRDYRVFVVMSDGECNEGTVWEAAMFAAARRLGHLTVVVDYNKWQATGRSNEVMELESLAAKWTAFGWDTVEVDGHDLAALVDALEVNRDGSIPRGLPRGWMPPADIGAKPLSVIPRGLPRGGFMRPAEARPRAIIAHTIKGKGVSFMEDDNNWHYRIPKAEEVAAAAAELSRR